LCWSYWLLASEAAASSVVGAAVYVTGRIVSGTVDVVGAGVSGAIDLAASDDKEKKESGEQPAPAATIVTEPVLAPVD
jgi:hypothetical protein